MEDNLSIAQVRPSTELTADDQRIKVAPGTVLLQTYTPDEHTGTVIVAQSQELHAGKKGNNFPMGRILAIGEIDLAQEAIDKQRVAFCKPGDIVWFDHRGTGIIMLKGEEYIIAPRQYIRGVLMDVESA